MRQRAALEERLNNFSQDKRGSHSNVFGRCALEICEKKMDEKLRWVGKRPGTGNQELKTGKVKQKRERESRKGPRQGWGAYE